jgi:Ser/Thr protein kinase RdoA (MazF antagonist)
MDPDRLAALCAEFALGVPVSLEEDHEGVLNRNYRLVTDTGHYFIKAVRDRRKDSIPIIAAAETFMSSGGIPAVCMLRTKKGELFLRDESEVYTVYPHITHVHPAIPPYTALGTMLARIHIRGNDALPPTLESVHMTEKNAAHVKDKLMQYRSSAAEGTSPIDTLFLAYIDRKLELLPQLAQASEASSTLVHGDYHTRNILFSENGDILGICDWEKAELAPRAYEIARSVQYICFESREAPYIYDRQEAVAAAKKFLGGYRQQYPISNEELSNGFALRLRKLVMSFWIEEAFYDRADDRANRFIKNETRLLHEFAEPALVAELLKTGD